jgi:hypothetical protein
VDPDWGFKWGWSLQRPYTEWKNSCNLINSKWQFPQRGPYANEIRWNKHDSRIVANPPFYRGGGMGHVLDQDNPSGPPND